MGHNKRAHRTNRRRAGRLLFAAAVTIGLATVPTSAAAGPPATPGAAAPARPAAVHAVTLVTGDQVRYSGRGAGLRIVSTTAARSDPRAVFITLHQHGDWYVVPTQAWAGVANGTLDRDLFDITLLAREGLDDAHTTQLGVIVTGRPANAPKIATRGVAAKALPAIHVAALSTPKADAAGLWNAVTTPDGRLRPAAGTHLWLDGRVHATDDESTPLIGAPTAWRAGYTGRGITVAVLDTGIDAQHPDLVGKVGATANFTDSPDTDDHVGHGTHVASIITGSGAASGGRYVGVAPGVHLISGKVLDDTGYGTDSGILAGMDWAVAQGAKIVNLSLGGGPSDGTDVLSTEIDRLSAVDGTLFVVAAGNDGRPDSIEAPGSATAALTVASTTKQDTMSAFSSAGPRYGDFGAKPDIAAPGSGIVAARAPGTLTTDAVDQYYAKLDGTSMATPHVAGAAAILAEEHPSWTGDQLKAALMDSAKVLPGIGVFQDGAGRVDVAAATRNTIESSTPDVGFGLQPVGTNRAQPVRYENDGPTAVRLSLQLHAVGANGAAAPRGVLTVDRTTVTVPAHGSAAADVDLQARSGPSGGYSGRLIATAPGVSLSTPIAGEISPPTSTVRLQLHDRSGGPVAASDVSGALQNEATGDIESLQADPDDPNTVSAQVPNGTYRIVGGFIEPGPTDLPTTWTFIAHGGIRVSGDLTLPIDSAGAGALGATLDQPGAVPEAEQQDWFTLSAVDGSVEGDSFVGVESNLADNFISEPRPLSGLNVAYLGPWDRPQDTVRMVAPDRYTAGDVIDTSATGWQGDITAPVVDIGETTDPAALPPVAGKVVLFAPPVAAGSQPPPPPDDATLAALAQTLKDRGARLILSKDYFADTATMPVLQLFDPNDTLAIRADLAAGHRTVHVVGRPTSPYLYALYRTTAAAVPHGVHWTFRTAALGRVDSVYRQPTPDGRIATDNIVASDPVTGLFGGIDQQSSEPGRRTDYYSPDILWQLVAPIGIDPATGYADTASEYNIATTYAAGEHRTATWGAAPVSPALPHVPADYQDGKAAPWAYRQGDKVYTVIPAFSAPDPDHLIDPFDPTGDSGSTRLYRGTTLVDGSDAPGTAGFVLPAGRGRYRLVVDARRSEPGWMLSPHVHVSWGFTSTHTAAAQRSALPLLSAYVDLPLDSYDAAPASRSLTGSVLIAQQDGSTSSRITTLAVQVSYDGGTTWAAATVAHRGGGRWSVTIPHPRGSAAFATLRISSADAAGNTMAETIDRAYNV